MQKISKNLIIAGSIIIVIAIGAIVYLFFGKTNPVTLYSVEAKNGNITEKISLTGQVKASQGVDLAFETQGKVVRNYVKVGDKIYAGEPLLAIDSSALQAQLQLAQAQLQEAQAKSDGLNINTVENTTSTSLQGLYADSISAAQKSVNTAKDILLTMSDIQFSHFTGETQQNKALHDTMEKSIYSLLGQPGAVLWSSQNVAQLNGGAYSVVQNAINNPTQANINLALSNTQTALQDVNNLVNAVPIDSSLTPAERASISLAKTNINLEIITTSANIQAISSLKVNNSATITTAGSQIEAAKAGIEAAQANIDSIKTQISKTVLTALFNGQVDKDNTIVGQIVSPNIPVVTISNNNLEIDTNIPEIDIADAKLGDNASVTLDAYGNGVIFPATIISIDSAPSVINGISAYGAKLKFKNTNDKIKPGMTSNITVVSDTHTNVLLIPRSAVIQNNNKYFVMLDNGSPQKEVREITVGLKDDKNIEVTSGLKSGEKVFAY